MEIWELNDFNVKILKKQSTYLLLKVDTKLIRVNFRGKIEFNLRRGSKGTINFFDKHPLLIDHNEKVVEAYINSRTTNPEKIIEELGNSIDTITKGFRPWQKYINEGYDVLLGNLRQGWGCILKIPITFAPEIIKFFENYGLNVNIIEFSYQPPTCKLLTIGDNYVIANDFWLEPVI